MIWKRDKTVHGNKVYFEKFRIFAHDLVQKVVTMMDVDSELQLYNHVEFLSTRNNPRREQSDRKNVPISKRDQRNRKKQTQPKVRNVFYVPF